MTNDNDARGALTFRKKPVTISAIQWTGENGDDVQAFLHNGREYAADGWVKGSYVEIGTLEGLMVASIGDWIIRGVAGEFYPCNPDIFSETYEPADSALPAGDGLTDEVRNLLKWGRGVFCTAGWEGDEWVKRVDAILAAPRQPGEVGAGVQRYFPDFDRGVMQESAYGAWVRYEPSREFTCQKQACDGYCRDCYKTSQVAASAQQDEREARPNESYRGRSARLSAGRLTMQERAAIELLHSHPEIEQQALDNHTRMAMVARLRERYGLKCQQGESTFYDFGKHPLIGEAVRALLAQKVQADAGAVAEVAAGKWGSRLMWHTEDAQLQTPVGTLLYTRPAAESDKRECPQPEICLGLQCEFCVDVGERWLHSVNIDAAARTLAECMDYPWEPMPEQGRLEMKKHARRVIDAAMSREQSGGQ